MEYIQQIAPIQSLLPLANHVDVKNGVAESSDADGGLRRFIAGFLGYNPAWMKGLYAIRWGFVRLLGMRQEGIPQTTTIAPEKVTMTPGEKMAFFTVAEAKEGEYWLCYARESHLTAYLGIVAEPLGGQKRRFHVVTIVQYHKWTGPVYFNVIRPFHHLVVAQMIKAGLRRLQEPEKWAGALV